MEVPQTLQDLDLSALVGQSVDRARESVEQAGGVLRTVEPDGAMTADYRPTRVTVVVRDGVVLQSLGIG